VKIEEYSHNTSINYLTCNTTGFRSPCIQVYNNNYEVKLRNSRFFTLSNESHGVSISTNTNYILLSNLSIETFGNSSHGLSFNGNNNGLIKDINSSAKGYLSNGDIYS